MPRPQRNDPGGFAYHVLNRANGSSTLFHSPECYALFLQVVAECVKIERMRLLSYCLMPNHWHLLLWPREDGDLRRFMQRLGVRHAKWKHERDGTVGRGHLYQGRYKSFIIRSDRHFLTVCRYIERNPVRAGLVEHAEDWEWSSAAEHSTGRIGRIVTLAPMPTGLPADWRTQLNQFEAHKELAAVRSSVRTGLEFRGLMASDT